MVVKPVVLPPPIAALLERIIAESAAGLVLWERWRSEISRSLPPWAKEISNATILVRVVLVVPDDVELEQVIRVDHADGTVERRLVQERQIVGFRNAGGWVSREVLGGNARTEEGRARIQELRTLERNGLVERDSRHWWRPTATGLRQCGAGSLPQRG